MRIRIADATRREGLRSTALVALAVLVAAASLAQPAPAGRELLNSERIEQRFGSYGIEVLEQNESVRVSNLYSGTGEARVTRTFAVVLYPESPDAAYSTAHEEILAGGSIGAVLTKHGWTVRKHHRFFGELASAAELERLMGIEPQPLATHVYVLEVARADLEADYATIVEMHHPDYLGLADLRAIYGDAYAPPVNTAGLRRLVDVLERAEARAEKAR